MEYEVKKSFNNFQEKERYTYVGSQAYGFGDRSVEGYEHFFHDADHEKLQAWRVSNDLLEKEAPLYFAKVGGWDMDVRNSILPIDTNRFDLSEGKKLLNPYIPYFKSLMEGEKEILNWRYWIAEHGPLLEKIFPRMEYLQWKINPMQEIVKFLRESNVLFKRNSRYLWIDNDLSKYLNL